MIKWLNEYSDNQNDRQRGPNVKRDTHESQMIPVIQNESKMKDQDDESEDSEDEEPLELTIRALYSELEGI